MEEEELHRVFDPGEFQPLARQGSPVDLSAGVVGEEAALRGDPAPDEARKFPWKGRGGEVFRVDLYEIVGTTVEGVGETGVLREAPLEGGLVITGEEDLLGGGTVEAEPLTKVPEKLLSQTLFGESVPHLQESAPHPLPGDSLPAEVDRRGG